MKSAVVSYPFFFLLPMGWGGILDFLSLYYAFENIYYADNNIIDPKNYVPLILYNTISDE